jgi:hypothetical protein
MTAWVVFYLKIKGLILFIFPISGPHLSHRCGIRCSILGHATV